MQDAYYPGGTAQYSNVGKVNIEFETKVYKDILAFGCCYIFRDPDIPSEIRNDYVFWIESIKSNKLIISDSDYLYWLSIFNQ